MNELSQTGNMSCRLITPHGIPAIWSEAGAMINRAVERGDGNYTLENVFALLVNNHAQLWVAVDEDETIHAAMVTQITNFPQKMILTVLYLAGKHRKNWQIFMDDIELWAKNQGCVGMEAYARKGLLRWLPDWRRVYTVIRKDIE